MSLRALNRCRWITAIPALLAWYCVSSSIAAGESPLVAARVSSLAPIAADLPLPVVTALAIDPSGTWLAVAGDDKTIRILQASNLNEVALLRGHRDLIRTIEYRHDGKILASAGNDGSLILWEQSSGYKEVRRVDELPAVCCAKFSPDGKQLAAVGFDAGVLIFGSGADGAKMQCDCNDLRACAYDLRGERLAIVGRSGHVHLFDPRTGTAINDFDLHAARIRDCDFTADGQQLVTVGEDGAAILFDLKRAEVVRRVDLLPCKLFALARIDEKHVAVAGSDNRIRIVDFNSGLVVSYLDGHRGSISALAYSNGLLYSGGFDATLRRWPIAVNGEARVAEKDTSALPPKESSSR